MLTLVKLLLFTTALTSAYNIPSISLLNRRDTLVTLLTQSTVLLTTSEQRPICVIGASGTTGRECITTLALQQQPVRAVSRTMLELDSTQKKYIEQHNIDIVKDQSKISDIIKGTSAVIFLANAKKYERYRWSPQQTAAKSTSQQQTYEDIDVHSLKSVATACIKHKVPRLVYVSASCRSCTLDDADEELDKMSGITCQNCQSKQAGEKILKTLYKDQTNLGYTIIRIGFIVHTGTYEGERRGPKELELNQDYTKSGMISKYDLADLCINAAQSKDTASKTFEAYYRDTAHPFDISESLKKCTATGRSMEECFFGSAFKNNKPRDLEDIRNTPLQGSVFATGAEHIGDSYQELFKNLKID